MQFVMDSGDSHAPRRKVKTGCSTCRTRKVKCDEGRPSCQRCVSTGRTCDGYASPFRAWEADKNVKNESRNGVHGAVKPYVPGSGNATSAAEVDLSSFEKVGPITADDIAQLQRCFSTKTLFPTVTLACDDEARQVLQASKTDPAVRHAVTSLRALRADLEAFSSSTRNHLSQAASSYAAGTSPTPSHDYGLQQYCMALGGLASNLSLSTPSSDLNSREGGGPTIRSALLCCQVFISIEQVRGNFAAMAQHIVQGLRILYENCKKGEKTREDNLPALDIFVIKLFAAPCKFADMHRGSGPSSSASTPASTDGGDTIGTSTNRIYRPLAVDVKTELTRLALSTVTFVGNIKAGAPPASLLSTKQYLLRSLAKWHASFEREQQLAVTSVDGHPELLSVLFLRFFHQVLRVVLIGSLDDGADNSSDDSGRDDESKSKTRSEVINAEYKQLQSIASTVGDRVRAEGRKGGEW